MHFCNQEIPFRTRVAVVVFLTLVLLWRVPDMVLLPQFWGDEGSSFYRDAICEGFPAIYKHYSGYYHVTPRLIAFLASFAHPAAIPAIYGFGAIMLTAVVLWMILSERVSLPYRPLLAAAVVLVPHDGEVFANLTNIQWILAIGLIIILFMRPSHGRWPLAAEAAYLLLAGMTGTYIITFLPAFFIRLWLDRADTAARRRMLLLTFIAVTTSLIQWYSVSYTNEDKAYQYASPIAAITDICSHFGNAVKFSAARVYGSATEALLHPFAGTPTVHATMIFSLVIAAVVLALLFRNLLVERQYCTEQLLMLYFMAILLFAAFYRNSNLVATEPSVLLLHASDRYFYIPKVLLCWQLLLLLKTDKRPFLPVGLLLAILTTSILNFQRPPRQDLKWSVWAERVASGQPVKIPINPVGWVIDLSCREK